MMSESFFPLPRCWKAFDNFPSQNTREKHVRKGLFKQLYLQAFHLNIWNEIFHIFRIESHRMRLSKCAECIESKIHDCLKHSHWSTDSISINLHVRPFVLCRLVERNLSTRSCVRMCKARTFHFKFNIFSGFDSRFQCCSSHTKAHDEFPLSVKVWPVCVRIRLREKWKFDRRTSAPTWKSLRVASIECSLRSHRKRKIYVECDLWKFYFSFIILVMLSGTAWWIHKIA